MTKNQSHGVSIIDKTDISSMLSCYDGYILSRYSVWCVVMCRISQFNAKSKNIGPGLNTGNYENYSSTFVTGVPVMSHTGKREDCDNSKFIMVRLLISNKRQKYSGRNAAIVFPRCGYQLDNRDDMKEPSEY